MNNMKKQVWNKVGNQNWKPRPVGYPFERIADNVRDRIEKQILLQIEWSQFGDPIWWRVYAKVMDQIRNEIKYKILDHV